MALLLAVLLAASVFSLRRREPARLGVTTGPQSWWACALAGYAGNGYAFARFESADAALVPFEAFAALRAEGYEVAAVTSCLNLTAVEARMGGKPVSLAEVMLVYVL